MKPVPRTLKLIHQLVIILPESWLASTLLLCKFTIKMVKHVDEISMHAMHSC